jgi:hypothetical protein
MIPLETLLDGLERTLTASVLPDVGSRFARGQLYAVVDVLRNLRDRIEPKAELLAAEAESAAAALERVAAVLDAQPLREALAAAAGVPLATRVVALRAALVDALGRIDALPDDRAREARAALNAHLAAQAMRDLAVVKPSLLSEISKG